MSACVNCGGSNLVDDAHHFESQKVCTDCGALVSSEARFDWTAEDGGMGAPAPRWDHTRHSTLPDVVARHQRNPTKTRTYRDAMTRLHNMAVAHSLSRAMRDEAIGLFQQAYDHAAFNYYSRNIKILLAGCCIYVVARQHSWPLSLHNVASYMQVHPYKLNSTFKRLLDTFQLTVPSPDIEDMAEAFVFELADSGGLRGCDIVQLTDLMRRTLRLTRLVLLSTGVCYRPLLQCVAYVVWCHLTATAADNTRTRQTSFPTFCKNCGFVANSTTCRRLTEVNAVLTSLRDQIPWISERQREKKKLYLHLDSILRYSHALVKSHADAKWTLVNDDDDDAEDDTGLTIPSASDHDTTSGGVKSNCGDGEPGSTNDIVHRNIGDAILISESENSNRNSSLRYIDAPPSEMTFNFDVSSNIRIGCSTLAEFESNIGGTDSSRDKEVSSSIFSTSNSASLDTARPLFRRPVKRKLSQDNYDENEMATVLSADRLAALESTELTEEDLLDGEISKYIRTDTELRFIEQLKKRFSRNSDD